ncbi:MAG TPA: ABC transporter permease [Kofleriaceae bacterium]|jgi:putative ABC transport system permease protein
MFDLDKWKEIWATLRSNPLRTFLTAFGVFWGIVMLMAMLAFGSAIQTGSQRQMKGIATNMMFMWGMQTTMAYDGMPVGRWVQFDSTDIELLRRLPGVQDLAPRNQLGGWMNGFSVVRGAKSASFTVMGDYPALARIVAFEYDPGGRFLNDRDVKESRKVAVIGQAVKEQLFEENESPVGQFIKISGVYFQVIGVTHTFRTGQQGERDANTIFIPFTTLNRAFNIGDRVGFFAMTATPNTDGPELERQVREALMKHHKIDPKDDLALGSFNMFVMFGKINMVFFVLQLLSWTVGGATLLAGVVGVSNIMLITVKERTKEIGVRKALGATPLSIVSMVMKESVVLTAIAGLIGVAAGVGLLAIADAALSAMPDSPMGPPNISLTTVLIAVAVLVISGAIAGIMPASHAASIKPIEALRAE